MSKLDLIPTSEAARILGLTTRKVTRMAIDGELAPVAQAPGIRGSRFFLRTDIERLARARAEAAAAESERILSSLGTAS